MLVSDSKRFVFVHVYKTGGKSIRTALRPYRDIPTFTQRLLQKLSLITIPSHLSAQEVQQEVPERWKEYFTFAFVRNPWSWQVSLYHYMQQRDYHHQHDVVSKMSSFEEYIDWRVNGHVHLQHEYVADENGDIMVDYVGRLEMIESDFEVICNRVGAEASLPHKNKSAHKDYKAYYNPETRALIEEYYAKDIDRFGYSFDGLAKESIN